MRENIFSFQALIFFHLLAHTQGSPGQSCQVQLEQCLAKFDRDVPWVPWRTPGRDGMSKM